MKITPRQRSLYEGERMNMAESIRLSLASLEVYGDKYEHWVIPWSGGKDSTTVVTFATWAIEAGHVRRPKSVTVMRSDTRQEIPLLDSVVARTTDDMRERGMIVRTVVPALDKRFLVNILGRGVVPPNNKTNRWCTRQLKLDPMRDALAEEVARRGTRVLMLPGLRLGESAARDTRIVAMCSKDDGECGQGAFEKGLPSELCDRLSPIVHWRVCHVWEWLKHWAPLPEYGDWSTEDLADVYGGEETAEIAARFGCVGCALVQDDKTLRRACAMPGWEHLTPLLGLQPLYDELRAGKYRLRKTGGRRRKDGKLCKGQQRLGALTPAARAYGLERILGMQDAVNRRAKERGRPGIELVNAEEEARIRELIAMPAWPEGWTGDELRGDVPVDKWYDGGQVQPLLFSPDELMPDDLKPGVK